MRYVALAADYDGTIATHGRVPMAMVDALRRFGSSGRKLILVTGRELDELLAIFPEVSVFDRVVAENGALLYCPATRAAKALGEPAPPGFSAELRRRGVDPLSVGRSIVATVTPHENVVLDTIRDFGLELQVIFNKGAVMVLPAGVNKATGLAAALQDLHLSARNVAAIGDAENDHALLRSAEFGAAVGNALPTLKRDADWVSVRTHGEAVTELIEAVLSDDLRALEPAAPRRKLVLGAARTGEPVTIPAAGCDVFVTGPSGSGKSVFAAALLEQLAAEGYQYCVFDAEGDYADLTGAIALGSHERAPSVEELANALAESADACLVVCLAALAAPRRIALFKEMLARVNESRATRGRPHWVVVGEAHCMFPAADADPLLRPHEGASSMLYVSVHPQQVARPVLGSAAMVTALGSDPHDALRAYCEALGEPAPAVHERPAQDEAIAWCRAAPRPPIVFRIAQSEAKAHAPAARPQLADLPPERSFYFRGPQRKQNLRAQNLPLFVQIGRGVDDETWLFHLREGDYSRWLESVVGETKLTSQIAAIEAEGGSAEITRERIAAAIESYLRD
jgi:hydroxymethylpyrimidine pyrophosphatase-like HAD family hydrolase